MHFVLGIGWTFSQWFELKAMRDIMPKLLLYREVATNSKGALFNLNEKFSKILVGIDDSKPSMDALDYAITLAQSTVKNSICSIISSRK
jgi:hypothetical protein